MNFYALCKVLCKQQSDVIKLDLPKVSILMLYIGGFSPDPEIKVFIIIQPTLTNILSLILLCSKPYGYCSSQNIFCMNNVYSPKTSSLVRHERYSHFFGDIFIHTWLLGYPKNVLSTKRELLENNCPNHFYSHLPVGTIVCIPLF